MTSHEWGRVDSDGTVYVRTADGERSVGQYPEGTPEEALAFYTERYAALAFEVELLEKRINSGVMSPEEAAESVKKVAAQVDGANAVGDLVSLTGRLDALGPVIATQREARKAEKAAKQAEAKAAKEKVVAEAEKIAEGTDWRGGANRLRERVATRHLEVDSRYADRGSCSRWLDEQHRRHCRGAIHRCIDI